MGTVSRRASEHRRRRATAAAATRARRDHPGAEERNEPGGEQWGP